MRGLCGEGGADFLWEGIFAWELERLSRALA